MIKVLLTTLVLLSTLIISCKKESEKEKENISDLLGQNIKSEKAQSILNLLGQPKNSKHDELTYYVYKDKGVELIIKNEIVEDIIFYSDGKSNNRQFNGELPSGIEWTDTRDDLNSKLGTPTNTLEGSKLINTGCQDFWKGLGVEYSTYDPEDYSATVVTVHLDIRSLKP